jgi:thiol-disulfide isomerase/thioredoxin
MHVVRTFAGVTSLAILSLMFQTAWGQTGFQTQIKKVVVIDANGVPIPDARVYKKECLVWNSRTQTTHLIDEEPWRRTDANGVFSFEFVRQGAGRVYCIADASLDRVTCLYIPRQDPAESYAVRLERPARIKGTIRSVDIASSQVRLKLRHETGNSLFPLLSANYDFDTPVHELAVDVLCPAGCDLDLDIEAEGFSVGPRRKIASLKPGEVLDMGAIELLASSGFKVLGKPAPALQVAEWVKGEPATLASLKGKVVLLDFWGLWCGPCRKAMPKFAELHEKYAKDGLVIIAIHDSSQSRASLLDKNQQYLDLSGIPFRVAVDQAPENKGEDVELRGRGKSISAYGVTSFPTPFLIDRDGQVQTSEVDEEHIYSLLYGRPMPKPATLIGRLMAADHTLLARMKVAIGLILLLMTILVILWSRRPRVRTRDQRFSD